MSVPRTKSRRGASLYLTVTGVGLMVSAMALTASLIGRLQMQTTSERTDSLKARAAAHSGLQHALNWINRSADWRTQLTSGTDRDDVQLSEGVGFRWRVTDTDGDLADDARDHAVLRSVGFVNNRGRETAYAYEVDIEPAGRGLTCLSSAVHAQTEVDVANGGATLTGLGTVTSNGGAFGQGNGADIQLPVEVNGSATGGDFNGGVLEGAVLRENPGDHVFDWYVQRGTRIAFSNLTAVLASSSRRLSGVVLSRELNPFGEPNPLGIYVIDCESQDVRIRWSRILGTLVLLNAGSGTQVEDVSVISSVPSNRPALLVQGDLEIDLNNSMTPQSLVETIINYNPPGAPDASGVEDNDFADTYPAQIEGIVYATGTIRISDDTRVLGNLIADLVTVDSGEVLEVQYQPYAANYPPPGFSAGLGARVLPGTLRRVSVD